MSARFTEPPQPRCSFHHGSLENCGLCLQDLAELNKEYFDAFKHIFIICATGKSAVFMRDELERRCDRPTSGCLAQPCRGRSMRQQFH